MITTVYIIRHGRTIRAEEKRYVGHLDIALSPEGEKQMERLADHLVIQAINKTGAPSSTQDWLDAVYCSDLQRAMKSAEIIARPFGLYPVVIPALRERSFGCWEGMNFEEINCKYPDDFKAWVNNPFTFFPVGGESTETVRDRVVPAFFDIIKKMKGKKIAIVAHGGINRIILCDLLGIPLQNLFKIEQDFSALNVCIFYDEFPVVQQMNRVITDSQI